MTNVPDVPAPSTEPASVRPASRFPIVRLQVQAEPLKVGRAPLRRYDPSPIESVPRLEITPTGVFGLRRGAIDRFGAIVDVHNVEHPQSRDRKGTGGVSVMGTGDYASLRARYGDHLTEGIAGETILVEAPDGLARLSMPSEISIVTGTGTITLTSVRVADPCVEFSRFCLCQEPSPEVDDAVRQALIDLDDGARGYRAAAAENGVVALGEFVQIG